MKVVWFIQNLVSYHHARFEAFARLPEIKAYLIQVTDKDQFSVLEFKPRATHYQLITLFSGAERVSIPSHEIRSVLFHMLSEIEPDVVCISGWGMEIGQLLHLWALENNVPTVMFSESTAYDERRVFLKEWVKSKLVRSVSSALVGGAPHKEYISQLGMSRESVFLGHNIVDSEHFSKPYLLQPDSGFLNLCSTPFFLVCTRFGEKKNLTRLIEAYAIYEKICKEQKGEILNLVIAGDGDLRTTIERNIVQFGLSQNVHLLGAVSYEKLPWLYQNCEAFIHASTTEQWGLVVNEAMAAGAPVLISNRVGCALDLVHDCENGFQFDPYNLRNIADALFSFSKLSVDQKNEFGEHSKRIIADWGPSRFANGLKQAVDKAIDIGTKGNNFAARLLLRLLLLKKNLA